jgi:hypothetical protein
MSDGMITRSHFYGYRPDYLNPETPPWHCCSLNPMANYHPLPRPQLADVGQPGPALVLSGGGMPSLGIDPTDPSTWGSRGYRQSPGMIGRFNGSVWQGNVEELNPLGAP